MNAAYEESRDLLVSETAFRIEGAAVRAQRRYATEEILTPTPQLLIPIRSAFIWREGSSQSLVTANHLLMIGAGSVGRDSFLDDRPVEFLLLTPALEAPRSAWGRQVEEIFSGGGASRVIGSTAALQHAACSLRNLCLRSTEAAAIDREEAAARLLGVAAAMLQPASVAPLDCRSKLVAEVKELIGAGRERISLSRIATELNASPAYLTDVFRRHEGVSLGRYQRRLRLSRALAELPGADDITSLALELGFSSHAHFSTAFKAMYRETPSQYRMRVRRSAASRRVHRSAAKSKDSESFDSDV